MLFIVSCCSFVVVLVLVILLSFLFLLLLVVPPAIHPSINELEEIMNLQLGYKQLTFKEQQETVLDVPGCFFSG